jgi:hypothetical protein
MVVVMERDQWVRTALGYQTFSKGSSGTEDGRGDIVKCCVSEKGASLLNDWLGGLLGLFFAIDELNADDDLGDEFKALKSTPMLLGFQGEFKDHRQGRDP